MQVSPLPPLLRISHNNCVWITCSCCGVRQAIAEAKYDAIKAQLAEEQKAHMKQKNATSMMWKFIRTRHRISAPVEPVSILEALRRSGKR